MSQHLCNTSLNAAERFDIMKTDPAVISQLVAAAMHGRTENIFIHLFTL